MHKWVSWGWLVIKILVCVLGSQVGSQVVFLAKGGANSTPAPEPDKSTKSAKAAAIEITVRGKAPTPTRGAADFRLEVGELKAVPRQQASSLLQLAPGILLTNEGSEAHAPQVFLRGFDAREGQDIEFSVEGVPINEVGNLHGNGYADTNFIIPELVTKVRLVAGPFDPRQGNFAVAGSADYELGLEERGIHTFLTMGSFATKRLLFLWGPALASKGSFAGVEFYQTAGYGQNRGGERATLMLQHEGSLTLESRYLLGFSAYTANFQSAGVIRADDYESGRLGFGDTYDSRQGINVARYSLYGTLESRLAQLLVRNQVFLIWRPLRLRENFTGFILDPQEPTQHLHGQRGDLIDLASEATTVGARGAVRFADWLRGMRQEWEIGYWARGDFVKGMQQRIEAATSSPYRLDNDLEAQLGDLSTYVDLNLRLSSWLSFRGGVRGSFFTYNVFNKCAVHSVAHPSRTNPPGDASCLSQQNFGAYREPSERLSADGLVYLPRASLIFEPLAPWLFSLAYGQGIRTIDPIYITRDTKTPFAEATSLEAGVAYKDRVQRLSSELEWRSSLFKTTVPQDLIFAETAGRNVLGGSTTRLGLTESLRLTGAFFDLATNLTYVRGVFDEGQRLIPYLPPLIWRGDGVYFKQFQGLSDVAYLHPGRFTLGVGANYLAPRPLPGGIWSASIFTLDAKASIRLGAVELALLATNLLDARYRQSEFNYVSFFPRGSAGREDVVNPLPTLVTARHFSAGAPRALFITLALHWFTEPEPESRSFPNDESEVDGVTHELSPG